jgi:FdhD protein
MKPGASGVCARAVQRLDVEALSHAPSTLAPALDTVAVEEPLEIRVAGEPVAVTMRTPGDDARLALGFLFAEGVIRSIDDVGTVAHCGVPGEEGYGNVLDVRPGPGVALDPDHLLLSRRGTLTTAACGVCGRRSIADLVARCGRLPEGPAVPVQVLLQATQGLREQQAIFARTGGTHAAAALSIRGEVLASFEDIGRHNAVDKVLGLLLAGRRIGAGALPGEAPAVLAVSGRASFEMVQKAAVARVPILASVSAASSLAIDLARATGLTLAAFVRGRSLNVYAGPERIEGWQPGL